MIQKPHNNESGKFITQTFLGTKTSNKKWMKLERIMKWKKVNLYLSNLISKVCSLLGTKKILLQYFGREAFGFNYLSKMDCSKKDFGNLKVE